MGSRYETGVVVDISDPIDPVIREELTIQSQQKNELQDEEQNILVSMIVFASFFCQFWTDFMTQNRNKIGAQSDAKSSIEKSRAQKRQKPSNRGLTHPANHRSEALGRG